MTRLVKNRVIKRKRSWRLGESPELESGLVGPRVKGARGPRAVRETVARTAALLRVIDLSEAELLAARADCIRVVENYEILLANGSSDVRGFAKYVRSVKVTHDAIDDEIHRRRLASGEVRIIKSGRGRPFGSKNKPRGADRDAPALPSERSSRRLIAEPDGTASLSRVQKDVLSAVAVGWGYDGTPADAGGVEIVAVQELVLKGYLARVGGVETGEVILTKAGAAKARQLARSVALGS